MPLRREHRGATDMRHGLLVALAGGALAGCMVGPDYRRPETVAPAAYLYAPQTAAETADTEWWKLFNDSVLDELIGGRRDAVAQRHVRHHLLA